PSWPEPSWPPSTSRRSRPRPWPEPSSPPTRTSPEPSSRARPSQQPSQAPSWPEPSWPRSSSPQPSRGPPSRQPPSSQPLLHLFDRDEVRHRVDHAADLRTVLLDDDVADPLQAKGAQRVALVLLAADLGLQLGHLQTRHQAVTSAGLALPAACARRRAAGATWSSGRPRRAATASGCSRPRSAATVACTMLIAFEDPSDLLRTSWMPAHSRTARTGPPAITPV